MNKPDLSYENDYMPPVTSRWWVVVLAFVLIYGFAVLLTVTFKAYSDKPPIPALVTDQAGDTLFTGKDVAEGQALFLHYGLHDNGSVWGHGAYLGPDFGADYLHQVALATRRHNPDAGEEQLSAIAKTNRYDPASGTLTFDAAQTEVFASAPDYWKEYFSKPVNNGGLAPNLITDPGELHKLSAFFAWSAWASAANRPGEDYSYTNNFPYEPEIGQGPSDELTVWSVASLLFLLIGIGACMAFVGRDKAADWQTAKPPFAVKLNFGACPASIRGLLKFVVVVALLLLTQTLVGGAVAHYRADPGNFYGLDLSLVFPSQLVRTWHLQLAILWIATGFVIGGLIISRIFGGKEWKGLLRLTYFLFGAFGVVIFGSLLAEWAGLLGWWGNADGTFWLGSQGWEYLEMGRGFQLLMIVGFLVWAYVIIRNTLPALRKPGKRFLGWLFLVFAICVPVFYIPAIFFDSMTHYTVVDTWRFWVIHLWVEGFFEAFATTMVAMVFVELGIVGRGRAIKIILLEAILTFMGGIIGTGHHWYFEGQTTFNMAVSSCFSAMEVVPLVLLCLEGYRFYSASRRGGLPGVADSSKWIFNFFMAVGFWNFLGAGVFGFLINMPIVSYFEIGTYLTPNHGHAAMFGVFGFLALGMCVYTIRKVLCDADWSRVKPWIKCSFWGFNIGLALMLAMSLLPGGFIQLWDVIHNGYWHARSIDFVSGSVMSTTGWLRMPSDCIFIIFGAVPMFVAACLAWYLNQRRIKHPGPVPEQTAPCD